jgi:hypothetical protein
VRGKSEKPLLHRWSENHNLTRRVLAVADHSGQRLAPAVASAKPDRLEFLPIAGRKILAAREPPS